MSTEKKEVAAEEVKGLLYQSLARTNTQIRQERGDAIAEDLELIYSRKVQDLMMSIKRLKRKQINMFDFSPTNTQSLIMAKDLDSQEVLEEDLKISLKIREEIIKLEEMKQRYMDLFGKTVKL